MRATIGLTDDRVNEEKYAMYVRWLTGLGPGIDALRLTPGDGNAAMAGECDAIVLTGGGDVEPSLYGGSPAHPTLTGVSPERDRFELDVLRRGLASGKPVLGICRGMQLANVAFGGTLVTDLGEAGYAGHRAPKGTRCEHDVRFEHGSALRRMLGVDGGTVTSSHHQAVRNIGRGLRVAATSPDGVVEALETPSADGDPAVILVQWHPERTVSAADPVSAALGKVFLHLLSSKKLSTEN